MNIPEIVWTAFATTCGTACVLAIGHLVWRRQRARADGSDRSTLARHLAIRVTCVLDRFVFECSEVVADSGEYENGELHASVAHPTLRMPDDVDWRSIPPELMYRLLSLPNAVDSAGKSIDYKTHVASPPGYEAHFDEVRYQFSKLGLMALDLVRSIRGEYDVPAIEAVRGWDPRQTFLIHTVERDGASGQRSTVVRNIITRTATAKARH